MYLPPTQHTEHKLLLWETDNLCHYFTGLEPQGKPKNTGVGSLSLLQGIFPTQESNRGLLHCRWILYQLSYQGSLIVRPSRMNAKKCPFQHRGKKCKVENQEIPGKRHIWPWSTKWSKAKANRIVPREYTGHSKHSSNNTRNDSTHGHHQMVNTEIRLIIFFAAKNGEALHSQQKQDWEVTVAQILTPYCKIQT